MLPNWSLINFARHEAYCHSGDPGRLCSCICTISSVLHGCGVCLGKHLRLSVHAAAHHGHPVCSVKYLARVLITAALSAQASISACLCTLALITATLCRAAVRRCMSSSGA